MTVEQPSVAQMRTLFDGYRVSRNSRFPLYWFDRDDPKVSGLLGLDETEFSIVFCDQHRGLNYRLRLKRGEEGYEETRRELLSALSDLPGAPAEWSDLRAVAEEGRGG